MERVRGAFAVIGISAIVLLLHSCCTGGGRCPNANGMDRVNGPAYSLADTSKSSRSWGDADVEDFPLYLPSGYPENCSRSKHDNDERNVELTLHLKDDAWLPLVGLPSDLSADGGLEGIRIVPLLSRAWLERLGLWKEGGKNVVPGMGFKKGRNAFRGQMNIFGRAGRFEVSLQSEPCSGFEQEIGPSVSGCLSFGLTRFRLDRWVPGDEVYRDLSAYGAWEVQVGGGEWKAITIDGISFPEGVFVTLPNDSANDLNSMWINVNLVNVSAALSPLDIGIRIRLSDARFAPTDPEFLWMKMRVVQVVL